MKVRNSSTDRQVTQDVDQKSSSWSFCAGRGISIAPGMELQNIPGRGTGVFATTKLLSGQRLMKVPTAALLTTASIPNTVVEVKTRKKMPVHALLAAYLTFGMSEAESKKYGSWMDTWPQLSDFTTSMPMFWPERHGQLGSSLLNDKTENSASLLTDGGHPFPTLPPPTTGSWLASSIPVEPDLNGSTCCADLQRKKLQSHIDSIIKHLPQYATALSDTYNLQYWRFIHNWCCVNTRCFYYVAPGMKPPDDANEAMAMCPAMDMFNHTDGSACDTRYDRTGYSVIADRNYAVGEEILLSYGAHSNDVLWAEYGFLLDENESDAIRIDKLVLDDLNQKEKELLAEYGYLGEYWLKKDGVCWRTEVVAWLTVLKETDWIRMVQEGWDPADAEQSGPQAKRRLNGETNAVHKATRLKRQKQKMVQWLMKGREEAESSLAALTCLSLEQQLHIFADDSATIKAYGIGEEDVAAAMATQAAQRSSISIKRWSQIWTVITKALRLIEVECKGSFVTMAPGRTQIDLDKKVEEVVGLHKGTTWLSIPPVE